MKEYKVSIKGVTPLLFNRFIEASIDKKVKKRAGALKEENPEDKLYKTKEGKIYTPSTHIRGMLINSGKNFKIQGKSRSTYSKLVGSVIDINPDCIEHKKQEWDIFKISAVNPNTRGRIMTIRPIMNEWELSFNLETTDDIPEEVIKAMLDYGGQYVGIGDWRPEKKGKYGKFIVTKFELVT